MSLIQLPPIEQEYADRLSEEAEICPLACVCQTVADAKEELHAELELMHECLHEEFSELKVEIGDYISSIQANLEVIDGQNKRILALLESAQRPTYETATVTSYERRS